MVQWGYRKFTIANSRFERLAMDDREQEVVTLLTANGGSMPYPALYQAVNPENRLPLRKTLVRLKARGSIKHTNVFNPETNETLHSVELVG
jgi:hypothetical protein